MKNPLARLEQLLYKRLAARHYLAANPSPPAEARLKALGLTFTVKFGNIRPTSPA
jgi:hypothetical protein